MGDWSIAIETEDNGNISSGVIVVDQRDKYNKQQKAIYQPVSAQEARD